MLNIESVRSPFEMIEAIVDLGKHIETCVNEFWDGITVVNPEKLVMDGHNFLMLYMYVILRMRCPDLFGYVKMMEEFSTQHVRSQSRFGYCMSTLQIAMERINGHTLKEILEQERKLTAAERTKSFARNMRESMALNRLKNDSLSVIDDTMVQVSRNTSFREQPNSMIMK